MVSEALGQTRCRNGSSNNNAAPLNNIISCLAIVDFEISKSFFVVYHGLNVRVMCNCENVVRQCC